MFKHLSRMILEPVWIWMYMFTYIIPLGLFSIFISNYRQHFYFTFNVYIFYFSCDIFQWNWRIYHRKDEQRNRLKGIPLEEICMILDNFCSWLNKSLKDDWNERHFWLMTSLWSSCSPKWEKRDYYSCLGLHFGHK